MTRSHTIAHASMILALGLSSSLVLPTTAWANPPDGEAAAPSETLPTSEAPPEPQAPAPIYHPPLSPQPIPAPTPNRNRGLGLTIAGFSVFGFSYLIAAVSATILIDTGDGELGRPLLVPVAGPFIAATRSASAMGGFALGFAGITQLAGLGMGIGGAVLLAKSRRQAQLSFTPGGFRVRF